jgi:uncharacterized membrane protein
MPSRVLFLSLLAGLGLTTPARADLQFCNKTSYVLDLALGLEDKGAAATRGWFRVEPGQCKSVMQGTPEAAQIYYVHARALAAYGPSPLPQAGQADFCIADGNFIIAAAKACNSRSGQRLMRFSEIKPSQTEQGLTAYLGEEADYDPAQARLAGVQRLLVIAGYDATPIDGLEGKKTAAALDQFLKDRRLPAETANGATFFQVLLDAVKEADGLGFSWCNETPFAVMAAIGIDEKGAVTTRGWYPGRCRQMRQAGASSAPLAPVQLSPKPWTKMDRRSNAATSRLPGAASRSCAPATHASRSASRRTAPRRD